MSNRQREKQTSLKAWRNLLAREDDGSMDLSPLLSMLSFISSGSTNQVIILSGYLCFIFRLSSMLSSSCEDFLPPSPSRRLPKEITSNALVLHYSFSWFALANLWLTFTIIIRLLPCAELLFYFSLCALKTFQSVIGILTVTIAVQQMCRMGPTYFTMLSSHIGSITLLFGFTRQRLVCNSFLLWEIGRKEKRLPTLSHSRSSLCVMIKFQDIVTSTD